MEDVIGRPLTVHEVMDKKLEADDPDLLSNVVQVPNTVGEASLSPEEYVGEHDC
jgi:hypothetical protein